MAGWLGFSSLGDYANRVISLFSLNIESSFSLSHSSSLYLSAAFLCRTQQLVNSGSDGK